MSGDYEHLHVAHGALGFRRFTDCDYFDNAAARLVKGDVVYLTIAILGDCLRRKTCGRGLGEVNSVVGSETTVLEMNEGHA
jgi:hypothetical protein